MDGIVLLKEDHKTVVLLVPGVRKEQKTARLSPVLLRVGKKHGHRPSDPSNPTTLSDVYFRVGGPHIGKAGIALEVSSDHVLIDHTWVCRGDHGAEGFTDTER